jgi:hypothetical protein
MFMFLSEMAFDDRFKFYFLKSTTFDAIRHNLFLYDDMAALTIKRVHNTKSPVIVELFTDKARCRFFSSYFRQTLKKLPLFYTHIKSVHSRDLLSGLKSHTKHTSTAYCYSTYPYLLYLSDELVGKILEYNKVSGAEKTRVIFEYKQMYEKSAALVRQIYCTSQFESALSGSNFELPVFTLILGKHIYASRKLMAEALKEWLVTLAESPNHEIMLSPQPLMECGNSFNCFVKQFYFAGFWRDDEILTKSQFTTKSYNIHMLTGIFAKEWERHEDLMKDKNNAIEHFKSIIQQLE